MRAIKAVLIASLVKEFYKANTGFFLIVLLLGFGFLKIPQHVDLASFLASMPIYYGVVFILFGLYAVKTQNFCSQQKKLASNFWLSYLILVPNRNRKLLMLAISFQLLFPVMGYLGFLCLIAFKLKLWFSAGLLLISSAFILILHAWILERKLIKSEDSNLQTSFKNWLNMLPKPFSALFIHHLLNRQSLILLGAKMVSIVVVIGSIEIYLLEESDFRYLVLGLLMAASINSILCFHYKEYLKKDLLLFRNLPISTTQLFTKISVTYFLLLVPEIAIFLLNLSIEVSVLLLLKFSLLPLSLLLFYHAICSLKEVNMESYMRLIFFISAFLFFVILGRVEPLFITSVLVTFSYFIMKRQVSNPKSSSI